jgi:hypothetical protein
MLNPADPRTEDTLLFELLRTAPGGGVAEVVGSATYRGGRTAVSAPEAVQVAVEELLSRAFVDRVHAEERPRGYRRSGSGIVDMLVPGMPEHFLARMRGLWLSYPDGSVVTARPASAAAITLPPPRPEPPEAASPVTDPSLRRATLAASDRFLNTRPIVRPHAPETGVRPAGERAALVLERTDCGWLA